MFAGIQLAHPAHIGDGAVAFSGWKFFEMKGTAEEVDCPIIGLALAFIADGHFKTGIAWPPHLPTDIAPQQMAFIL